MIDTKDIPAEYLKGILEIARSCHEITGAYCQALKEDQPCWSDASQSQKDTVIAGVAFYILNPEASASARHDSWLAQKIADGWSYGKIKNIKKKKHHCMVPFHHLPVEQQAKDYLFRAMVNLAIREGEVH